MGNAYKSVLSSGGGSGTSITPSNSSPVSMTGGETYTPTTNGVAVESVTNLTPANTSPPSISTGSIYKPTTSGKAIASIATNGSSVTPTSSGKYFYSGWNKMESSGYAYTSTQNSARGSVTVNTSTTTKVTLGFQPKSLQLMIVKDSTHFCTIGYDSTADSSYQILSTHSGSVTCIREALPNSTTNRLKSIDSDGFTMGIFNSTSINTYGSTWYYSAT